MSKILEGTGRFPLLALVLLCALPAGLGADEGSGPGFAGRPLIEALQDLQERGLRVIYSSDVVTAEMIVETEPRGGDLREVLDALLVPHGLQAREGPGGTLLILHVEDVEPAGDIGGIVWTHGDRRPVAGARVLAEGTGVEGITGRDGLFRIAGLAPGSYDLIVRVPGLRSERFENVPVRAGGYTEVTLDLAAAPAMLERVTVTPNRDPSAGGRPDAGRFLAGESIRREAGLGDDVHRAIAAQPGVAASDRSAEISVRGGEPDELLVLFDGLELYDPFHLKNFQSFSGIIDAMTVGSAEYFPGGFPVQYGDRMSGVLDLTSSIPDAPGRMFLSSSFINSRVLTDGTFAEGAGQWLVSARAWYPDAVVRTVDREREGFSPSYYDLLGKVQLPVGERTVLAANFLAARDGVDFVDPDGEESVEASSGNRYAWLTLKSLWSPRLYARTLFAVGRIRSDRNGRIEEGAEYLATVSDRRSFDVYEVAQDWSYRPSDRVLVKWGLGAKWLDADYLYTGRAGAPVAPGAAAGADTFDRSFVLTPSGRQIGAYVSGQFRPINPLQFEVGLRWDRQTYQEEGQVSPRLSIVREIGRSGRVRAAWGRYYQSQGIHELQVEDGVSDFFPAQLAEHWSIGYERGFGGGLTFRADAYLKEMSDLRPRFENLFTLFELLPEFETDRVLIAPDRAEARGVELSLAGDRGGAFSWWAAYSRSRIEDTIDGRRVLRNRDQPNALRFGLNLRRGDAWSVLLSGVYHTGWPTTPVSVATVIEPDGATTFEAVPGERNSARYPDYHRLDLRASRHFRLGGGRLTIFAEITNLYDRKNVCCAEDFIFLPGADGTVRAQREDGLWLERVPSLGIAWSFDY